MTIKEKKKKNKFTHFESVFFEEVVLNVKEEESVVQ